MTPKEKADDIIKKMLLIFDDWGALGVTQPSAKASALVAVDEILKSAPSKPGYGPYIESDIDQAAFYWQQVRAEIEKL
jgi:hypothetical protein